MEINYLQEQSAQEAWLAKFDENGGYNRINSDLPPSAQGFDSTLNPPLSNVRFPEHRPANDSLENNEDNGPVPKYVPWPPFLPKKYVEGYLRPNFAAEAIGKWLLNVTSNRDLSNLRQRGYSIKDLVGLLCGSVSTAHGLEQLAGQSDIPLHERKFGIRVSLLQGNHQQTPADGDQTASIGMNDEENVNNGLLKGVGATVDPITSRRTVLYTSGPGTLLPDGIMSWERNINPPLAYSILQSRDGRPAGHAATSNACAFEHVPGSVAFAETSHDLEDSMQTSGASIRVATSGRPPMAPTHPHPLPHSQSIPDFNPEANSKPVSDTSFFVPDFFHCEFGTEAVLNADLTAAEAGISTPFDLFDIDPQNDVRVDPSDATPGPATSADWNYLLGFLHFQLLEYVPKGTDIRAMLERSASPTIDSCPSRTAAASPDDDAIILVAAEGVMRVCDVFAGASAPWHPVFSTFHRSLTEYKQRLLAAKQEAQTQAQTQELSSRTHESSRGSMEPQGDSASFVPNAEYCARIAQDSSQLLQTAQDLFSFLPFQWPPLSSTPASSNSTTNGTTNPAPDVATTQRPVSARPQSARPQSARPSSARPQSGRMDRAQNSPFPPFPAAPETTEHTNSNGSKYYNNNGENNTGASNASASVAESPVLDPPRQEFSLLLRLPLLNRTGGPNNSVDRPRAAEDEEEPANSETNPSKRGNSRQQNAGATSGSKPSTANMGAPSSRPPTRSLSRSGVRSANSTSQNYPTRAKLSSKGTLGVAANGVKAAKKNPQLEEKPITLHVSLSFVLPRGADVIVPEDALFVPMDFALKNSLEYKELLVPQVKPDTAPSANASLVSPAPLPNSNASVMSPPSPARMVPSVPSVPPLPGSRKASARSLGGSRPTTRSVSTRSGIRSAQSPPKHRKSASHSHSSSMGHVHSHSQSMGHSQSPSWGHLTNFGHSCSQSRLQLYSSGPPSTANKSLPSVPSSSSSFRAARRYSSTPPEVQLAPDPFTSGEMIHSLHARRSLTAYLQNPAPTANSGHVSSSPVTGPATVGGSDAHGRSVMSDNSTAAPNTVPHYPRNGILRTADNFRRNSRDSIPSSRSNSRPTSRSNSLRPDQEPTMPPSYLADPYDTTSSHHTNHHTNHHSRPLSSSYIQSQPNLHPSVRSYPSRSPSPLNRSHDHSTYDYPTPSHPYDSHNRPYSTGMVGNGPVGATRQYTDVTSPTHDITDAAFHSSIASYPGEHPSIGPEAAPVPEDIPPHLLPPPALPPPPFNTRHFHYVHKEMARKDPVELGHYCLQVRASVTGIQTQLRLVRTELVRARLQAEKERALLRSVGGEEAVSMAIRSLHTPLPVIQHSHAATAIRASSSKLSRRTHSTHSDTALHTNSGQSRLSYSASANSSTFQRYDAANSRNSQRSVGSASIQGGRSPSRKGQTKDNSNNGVHFFAPKLPRKAQKVSSIDQLARATMRGANVHAPSSLDAASYSSWQSAQRSLPSGHGPGYSSYAHPHQHSHPGPASGMDQTTSTLYRSYPSTLHSTGSRAVSEANRSAILHEIAMLRGTLRGLTQSPDALNASFASTGQPAPVDNPSATAHPPRSPSAGGRSRPHVDFVLDRSHRAAGSQSTAPTEHPSGHSRVPNMPGLTTLTTLDLDASHQSTRAPSPSPTRQLSSSHDSLHSPSSSYLAAEADRIVEDILRRHRAKSPLYSALGTPTSTSAVTPVPLADIAQGEDKTEQQVATSDFSGSGEEAGTATKEIVEEGSGLVDSTLFPDSSVPKQEEEGREASVVDAVPSEAPNMDTLDASESDVVVDNSKEASADVEVAEVPVDAPPTDILTNKAAEDEMKDSNEEKLGTVRNMDIHVSETDITMDANPPLTEETKSTQETPEKKFQIDANAGNDDDFQIIL